MAKNQCVWPFDKSEPRCTTKGTVPVFDGPSFYWACAEHQDQAQKRINEKRTETFELEKKEQQELARLSRVARENVIKRLTRGDSALAKFVASRMFVYHGLTDSDVRTLARGRTPHSR